MAEQPSFAYGGQAVIEGVMIRGRNHFSLAVRRQDGSITHAHEPLNTLFTGRVRRFPFLRGGVVLVETLMLGVKALHRSANMAMVDQQGESEEEMSGWAMAVTLGFSLLLGIGIFFILPLLLVKLIDPYIASDLLSNVIEGLLRLAILVGYIWGIGFIKDIRRVYAYHGAEHMAVHAHEAGLPLNVENVRKFGTPHPRCGTAFLLTVVLVSIIIFAFLGRPDFEWRILSRIVLLPVVAGISYEIIRFSGAHQKWLIAQVVAGPGLLLQRLTTRQPDDAQIEVAITAMEAAIAADAGQEYVASFPPRNVDGEAASPVESDSE
ncbi:MAG: DUF1385 domain-containing protein [Chloroflexi bacterium]|nr:DUF1385 domain-containing protein [Chloroflexota bacterium]MDA1220190.1 DUF1385 domain-containing protein [Chloroflexota bacterium]